MSTPVLPVDAAVGLPPITFDDTLPVSARRDEIAATIAQHQVVVVAGETGSGKTTQLPKICLQLGRRSIGHTQPRRIAARSVADRVAAELGVEIGELVGYQVRFTRRAGRRTRLKVMTDGVLLAEIAHDRDLRRYDTIIVDEAHERSLNIDFLLGYLHQLLPRRPELKVIITSATIDTVRFAGHFRDAAGRPAPIIEVTGRTYPVEVRYAPVRDGVELPDSDDPDGPQPPPAARGRPRASRPADADRDQVDAVCDAVAELQAEGPGDVLVFLSGEREIRDTAEALAGRNLPRTEVLPLYARLSAAEQHRVFSDHPGRRVVLATNVAETSLTVPGIRFVVDAGTARISRYSARTKVQRLPIEPVSQASADQRAGRCGRLGPGICIRLYSEEDYRSRPDFTEPEILRTNLASVILQMAAADLGDIGSFPFVEAPDRAQITDGLRLLVELGALSGRGRTGSPGGADDARPDDAPSARADGGQRVRLTRIGHRLSTIPLDPRMGRMILAAERQGCVREVLVIVAGLSIVDPRERPAEHRERADALHRRFWTAVPDPALPDPDQPHDDQADGPPSPGRPSPPAGNDDGDFWSLLRLWDYVRERQHALSGNAFRRMCREEYLHFLRIREWQDLHTQLRGIAKELGINRNDEPASPDRVHTAVLTGLLSHVGLVDQRSDAPADAQGTGAGGPPRRRRRRAGAAEYLGARGTRFAINPGSSLARTPPELVMAAELVETTRLWARTVAAVKAEWVEEVAAHELKRRYAEPHWSTRSESVMAYETVSLYGVPIIARRRVAYARIDPVAAREIFLRSALVEGQWRSRHRFFAANQRLREEVAGLEDRTRRRDVAVDDDVIYAFYDARVPAGIGSAADFDSWWKAARVEQPELLTMSSEDLLRDSADAYAAEDFPDTFRTGAGEFAVRYRFDPTSDRDGVSVEVPLGRLNQTSPVPFSWQVPGLRPELVTAMIRSLPKAVRRAFVPAPVYARHALAWIEQRGEDSEQVPLPLALARALTALTGEAVEASDVDLDGVPRHLRPTFVVVDAGQEVAAGRDLAALQAELSTRLAQTLTEAAADLRVTGATSWVFGTIDPVVDLVRHGQRVRGYPALIDERTTVGLVVTDRPERQRRSHHAGLRRLVLLGTPDPTRWVVSHLSNADKLALGAGPYPSVPELLADARLASVGVLMSRHLDALGPTADEPTAADPLPVRNEAQFRRLCDLVRVDNADRMREVVGTAAAVLRERTELFGELPGVVRVAPAAADDLTEQLGNLVFPGFLSATPGDRLSDLVRYLAAARQRVRTLLASPARDAAPLETVLRCEDEYAELVALVPPGPLPADVEAVGWLLEELRVSLFAQPLRTRQPVSEKRVRAAIAAAGKRLGEPVEAQHQPTSGAARS